MTAISALASEIEEFVLRQPTTIGILSEMCRVVMVFCRDVPPGRLYPAWRWMLNPHFN